MATQTVTPVIQWQDFKVISDIDLVLNIAKQNGWKDCEIFGSGPMITQPQDSTGWKLVPADLYQYSIPAAGVNRILQIIQEGVRIQGVIIADDLRRNISPLAPSKPAAPSWKARRIKLFIGKALICLIAVAGAAAISLVLVAGMIFLAPVLILGAAVCHDPKLIILVDDGDGGTAWISVLTWYD